VARRAPVVGAVALVALLGLTLAIWPAQAAKPRKSTRYAGETRQGYKMSFVTSRNGKRIRRLRVTFEISCRRESDGLTSVRRAKFRMTKSTIKVARDGSFNDSIKVKGDSTYEVRGGRVKVNGHFHSRRRAGGTVRERLRLAEGLRCSSGDVNFTTLAQPSD
jgi:hypothetical protein